MARNPWVPVGPQRQEVEDADGALNRSSWSSPFLINGAADCRADPADNHTSSKTLDAPRNRGGRSPGGYTEHKAATALGQEHRGDKGNHEAEDARPDGAFPWTLQPCRAGPDGPLLPALRADVAGYARQVVPAGKARGRREVRDQPRESSTRGRADGHRREHDSHSQNR